ncbi:TonB-dependent receptor plug domain-containing protein [Gemmatimonas sp.]|uniref:TonB-dependent receptor plug domain-containing protein n=1 Tax=Gemmatimonas sp. TaxID=1962908 RepID=UPI003DA3D44A
MVDGKASTEISAQSIAAERIARIDIRKKSREAIVLSITTRTSFGSVEKTKPIGTNVESTISVQTSSPNSFDGLILLDNVRITPAEMNKLSPNKIESVEIIKGADAEKLYGAKGSEGVIKITTKK